MAQVTILNRTQALLRTLIHQSSNSSIYLRTITTTSILSQQPQYAEPTSEPAPDSSNPLPPNPASGSPLYSSNWRSPIPQGPSLAQSLIPLGILHQPKSVPDLPRDVPSVMNLFADWMTSQRWFDMKQLFELWVRSLDKNGKPNKPDVHIYNHYLRANLMTEASAADLLDLVTQMDEYDVTPNTASFNLVLKAMLRAKETLAAEKLVERMLQTGKESQPDDESYDLLLSMLHTANQVESLETALKYVDVVLKSGNKISDKAFTDIVKSLVNRGRSDTLVSVIEKCKASDQNKGLCPPWNICSQIAEVATEGDNSKLAFYALEFMARWIARGEIARPPVLLSVEEGVVVAALGTAARTYNSTLIDASWAVLKRSLREKTLPNPESFLGKIYAYASLGNLQKAFSSLHELESAYGNSEQARDILSPFTSLNPLVVACSKKGFETLDVVYFQLENLSRANPPYKSVAALNCVITGCANIWDLDRAYQTFEAINQSFGLSPDVNSFNALVYAFGKQKKAPEASDVFQHMVSVGIKPDATSYSLLVDAHLANRDPKSALAVIDDMINAGFTPTKDLLKKLRRRCTREMNYEADHKVDKIASKFMIRMRTENRRDLLFNLEYSTEFVERLS